jgi:hypothetical protein
MPSSALPSHKYPHPTDVRIGHITTLNAMEASGKCSPLKMLIITSLVGYTESPSTTNP